LINNFETALFAAIPVTLRMPTVEVELGHIDFLLTIVASLIYSFRDGFQKHARDWAILQLKHMPALALQPVLNSASALVTQVVVTIRILTAVVALGTLELHLATVAKQI